MTEIISKKNNPLPFSAKMMVISLMMATILGYSIIKKRYVDDLTNAPGLILKSAPEFKVKKVDSESESYSLGEFTNGESELFMVHFWGTWCAPCEVELPSYVEFIKQFKADQIKVLVLAVDDDEKKVKKFAKRLGDLPPNIMMGIDNSKEVLARFGTVKVPETYLFNKSGKHLYKYIGPQEWQAKGQFDRIIFYLDNLKAHSSTN